MCTLSKPLSLDVCLSQDRRIVENYDHMLSEMNADYDAYEAFRRLQVRHASSRDAVS